MSHRRENSLPAADLQEVTKKVYQIEEIYMRETCTDAQNKDDKL